MQAALKLIPAKTLLLPVESAGHDLKSKSVKVPDAVLSAFVDFFGY
jgi:hypothetical protein